MAKRKRIITQNTLKRKAAEKRGIGRFADYKPWLTIQEVTPPGLVTRIRGWKTGRTHHLFSKSELDYFYTLEWAEEVIDIREQFPLYEAETLAIAESLGFKHPADEYSGLVETLVTTFNVSIQKGIGMRELTRTLIHSKALNIRKITEKLEIERRYWELRNTEWGIVTEKEINPVLAKNINWVHSFIEPAALSPLDEEAILKIESIMLPELRKNSIPLRDITAGCERRMNLPPGCALSVVRHLIAARRLKVAMEERIIQPEMPLELRSFLR